MRDETQQPSGLISVLLDQSAEFGDRDDAAMDLASYDDPVVAKALLRIVLDHSENEDLIDSAGESLAAVWSRSAREDSVLLKRMHPARQFFAREP
ncbi:MAG: hypothetical protein HKN37_11555 [Rhodothermales bacterium]|nr:hypothetical protein [Rhodothermales bacterium]